MVAILPFPNRAEPLKSGCLDRYLSAGYTTLKSVFSGILSSFQEDNVTARVKNKSRNNLFARVLSIFLALLIVGGSFAALIELL
jgi:hypothetical protein